MPVPRLENVATKPVSQYHCKRHTHHPRRATPQFDAVVRIAEAIPVRVGWLLGEPTRIELTKEDEKMFRTVAAMLENITDATKAGRSITIVPLRSIIKP